MSAPVSRKVAAVLGAAVLLLPAACGGGSEDDAKEAGSSPSAEASEEPSEEPSEAATSGSSTGDKGDAKTGKGFVDPTTGEGNKWYPLKPGTQILREGTTMIGKRKVPHKVVVTVTDAVREINGVKTVLVLDEASGADQVVEKSVDYFALDGEGNVWVMGGITEAYENGKFSEIDEAWVNGADGAQGGILVPADPESAGEWEMSRPPGEDADRARFSEVKDEVCVPFDCYKNVMVVLEGLEKAVESELKYYADGVGQIKNQPKKSPEEDFEELKNVTELSGDGLKEASEEALRIDKAAAEEEPKMFGDAKAERIS